MLEAVASRPGDALDGLLVEVEIADLPGGLVLSQDALGVEVGDGRVVLVQAQTRTRSGSVSSGLGEDLRQRS